MTNKLEPDVKQAVLLSDANRELGGKPVDVGSCVAVPVGAGAAVGCSRLGTDVRVLMLVRALKDVSCLVNS